MKRYSDWKNGHEPFYPNHLLKQAFIVTLMIAVLIALIALYYSFNIGSAVNDANPQWYILPVYKIATLLKGWSGVVVVALIFALALAWPLMDRNPKTNITGRPKLLVVSVIFAAVILILGIWGSL